MPDAMRVYENIDRLPNALLIYLSKWPAIK